MLVVDSCPDSRKKMPFIRRKRNHSASVRNNQIEAQGLAWLCFAEDHSWFQGNILTEDESNYSLYGRKVCGAVKEQDELDETKQEEETKQEQSGDQDNYYDEELDQKLEQLIIRTTNASVGDDKTLRAYGSSSCSTSSSCEELEAIEEELNNNLPQGVKSPGNPGGIKKSPSSSSSSAYSSSRSSSPPFKVDEYYNVTLTDHFSGLRYELPKISVNNNREGEKNDLFVCADGQVNFLVENVFKNEKAEMMIQRHIDPSLLGKKCLVYHGPMTIVFNEIIDYGRSWCL